MIGNALRIDIEKYAARRGDNRLFAAAKSGRVTPETIARYLASLHFMLTFTPPHLTRARQRALELGDEALAAHFAHKLEEEVGHDQWAENDRANLQRTTGASRGMVMPSAEALSRYNADLIEEHPALYLTYIAFAEYVTVVIGPEFMELLEKQNAIARGNLTVVEHHVELDREHAEEGFAVIDDLVGDPRMLPRLREAMAGAMALFDAYCAEAAAFAAPESTTVLAASGPHVSAA